VCVAVILLAGCGGKMRIAQPTSTPIAVDPNAAVTVPIERRLRAAGYPVYPVGAEDPHAGAAFYTQLDWTTRHAFKLYIYPFATASAATAFERHWATSSSGKFASVFKIAVAGRVVYWANGGEYECYGECETEPIVERHFEAAVALAEGREP
jgi:hypothetical protein